MFIDEVKLSFKAGKWWDGSVAWRREIFIPKGGPYGWDGGKGGDIILRGNPNVNTLSDFRHKKVIRATDGEKWDIKELHGKDAEDLIIEVPVGTVITDAETGELIYDLSTPWSGFVLCKWGRGGYGNAHFASSTRQAPAFAEMGDIGEEHYVKLEMKLVADIGLIGLPNAGKSTLIQAITNVRPKIANYPFTTLIPNLGVMEHKGSNLVIEDVPGLIPGASEGKGLGIDFLKHIERTRVIIHLLDMSELDNIVKNYLDIRHELESFSETLAKKEELILLSKADLFDREMIDFVKKELEKTVKNRKIMVISAGAFMGIDELKDYLIDQYASNLPLQTPDSDMVDATRVYDLKDKKDANDYRLIYKWDAQFEIKWERLEQIVRMTNMNNFEAIMRVYDVLEKLHVTQKVENKLALEYGQDLTDSYFEWSTVEIPIPVIWISGRKFELDKTWFLKKMSDK